MIQSGALSIIEKGLFVAFVAAPSLINSMVLVLVVNPFVALAIEKRIISSTLSWRRE
jgi:flagellar biosynthesis protein FliQ